MTRTPAAHSWRDTLRTFIHPRVVSMLFLGFSAGMPLLLIFSSLSLWLREAGVDRAAVTFFSWAALGYSFKFVWAPLVDRLPLPLLTRWLGRRRSWLLLAQLAVIAAILWMAMIDPAQGRGDLLLMAAAAVLLGFSSATQDIVIDAYRIESAEPALQAMMSSSYIAGYRIGMLLAGAGALFLASQLGSVSGDYHYPAWRLTYMAMAAAMLVGVVTTLVIPEPQLERLEGLSHTTADYLGFLALFAVAATGFVSVFYLSSAYAGGFKTGLASVLANAPLAGLLVETLRLGVAIAAAWLIARLLVGTGVVNRQMVRQAYLDPVREFFHRYGTGFALLLLALVGLYRVSDIVLGVISNLFYQDLGFSKQQIAAVVKTFGLFMTIAGGFLGGLLAVRYGVMRILMLGAVLSAATNLLFMLLAGMGDNLAMLYIVISADNLSAGLASAAFIAFLSSLTSIAFTAVQYAIFSSIMTLIPKVLGGYSGGMVDSIGYNNFFALTALMGLPVLVLVWLAGKTFRLQDGAHDRDRQMHNG